MSNSDNSHLSASKTTVMILAAGEGRRMLPLTKSTPKPLLKIGKHSLLEHHLIRLESLGFKDIVINIAYLGSMIRQHIGDGSQFNLNIQYSDESSTGALETAGGILKALPLISSKGFLVINSDIWTDFDFLSLLESRNINNSNQKLGTIVLVNNPEHNKLGDFNINETGELSLIDEESSNTYTFSGIALYQKSIFQGLSISKQPLAPILKQLIQGHALNQIVHNGLWTDVGTPARLEELNQSATIT